jgi:hypothetical protein
MSAKTRSIALLTAGVLLFLLAFTADSLGLGSRPGLGYGQLILGFAGMILAAVGMTGVRRGASS